MSAIEWIAAAFGFACVVLTIRQNILCWPAGLVQVALYIGVFYHARLYSDLILHVIYVVLQVYGWWAWLHGGRDGSPLAASRIPPLALLQCVAMALAANVLIGAMMKRWTNASFPYWDASILVLSLIAQWLMARKILESWLFWIAVDVLAIPLYALKGLNWTTALYAVFLILAIKGFFEWRKSPGQVPLAQPA